MYAIQAIKKLALLAVLLLIMPNHAFAQGYVSSTAVRVWGDISTLYRAREFDDGDSKATQRLNTASVNASSYIWQPWFALVSGGLTLSEDTSDSSDQESVMTNFLSGNFQFNLFPSSRFPFLFYYNQSRNELDDDFFGREIVTTEYGISQQYRSEDGNNHYLTKFIQNQREEKDLDSFAFESLFFSSNHQFTNQSINTDILFDRVENEGRDEQAESYSLTGRHSYTGGVNFSLENLVSTSKVENDFLQSASDAETAQISSLLSWQPEGRDDINLTGAFRLSDLEFNLSQDSTTGENLENNTGNSTANLNQGLVYNFSERVSISQSANAALVESDGQEEFSASEAVGITYTSDRLFLDAGDYGWGVGSSFNNQHGDIETTQSLNNRFNHSLSSDFSAQERYDLRTNLSQSLSQDFRTNQDDEKRADHAFSITWAGSSTNNRSVVRFSISDSRSLDDEDSAFQLANLQYSGSFRFNRHTQLFGDVTLQKSKQKTNGEQSETMVSNGQLELLRERLFQVPRLRFRSRLKISKQQSENERFIENLKEDVNTDSSWENSLHYRIGRLETQLNLDFIESNDELDRLIKIRITRSFGDL